MPRGYRRSIATAVGLAVAFLAFSAQAPNPQRVPAPSPAVTGQGTNAANPQPQPTVQTPLPVQIIESPADAAHAQERETKTDKHDAEDLDAQVRAAKATEKQILPAWVGAILTFAGTTLLVWNLTEARRANRIAREALAQSERHAKQELQAYVLPVGGNIMISSDGKLEVSITFKNCGQTPAHDVVTAMERALVLDGDELKFDPWKEPINQSKGYIGPDIPHIVKASKTIAPADLEALKADKAGITIWGRVEYVDSFRREGWASFVYKSSGRQTNSFGEHIDAWSIAACEVGNETDHEDANGKRTPKPTSCSITMKRGKPKPKETPHSETPDHLGVVPT